MPYRRYVITLPIIEQRFDLAVSAPIKPARAASIRQRNRKFIL